MRKLHIASNLTLPADEAVTQTFGILAKRGVGKTYTASVVAEEMLKTTPGASKVVADPIGVWWGLRASADGKETGLPIYVFGGESKARDMTLEVGAGELVADVIIDERLSVVLDLSLFRKGEQITFMTAFAERLYHKNREALHLFIDEADAFAPQKPMKGQERLLGAMQDIVRRGRARGIGCTLITQRSAVLSKDVLTQIEVLVALRTISPQDRAAIDAWIEVHGTPEQREEMMASLPSLPIGDAWFWSPGWLDLFKRVHVRERETFDSSATPKAGERRVQPKQLAAVDLAALEKRMADTIERTKASDPKHLRAKVADLERQLAARSTITQAVTKKIERLEVPVLKDAAIASFERSANHLTKEADRLERWAKELITWGGAFKSIANDILTAIGKAERSTGQRRSVVAVPATTEHPEIRRVGSRLEAGRRPTPPQGTAPVDGLFAPSTSQQRILDVLAWLEMVGVTPAAKPQVAALAGQSPTSGGYFNNLGKLRSAGLIEYQDSRVFLTGGGRERAVAPSAPPTNEQLHDEVCAKVSGSQAKILRALIDIYPADMAKDDIAEATGQSPTSGGFFNNLGRLRSLGFIEYPTQGRARAADILFIRSAA